jgi:ribosomal-protein-alanine N-acetyltransferase
MESFFPTLYTARCTLRRIGPADKLRVFEGLSHPEVIRYYGVSYRTLEETQAQLDWYDYLLASETGIWWGICFTSDPGRLIGACGFNEWVQMHNRAETGYWLLPGYWGQGLMRECLSAILGFAFANMRMHRIVAVVEPLNHQSALLVQKLGFRHEGTHRQCEIKNGAYIDLDYYALLKQEWGIRELGHHTPNQTI